MFTVTVNYPTPITATWSMVMEPAGMVPGKVKRQVMLQWQDQTKPNKARSHNLSVSDIGQNLGGLP